MTNIRKIKSLIGLLPVMLIIVFVLAVGIFGALIQSLGFFPIAGMNEISLKYYIEILGRKDFLNSLYFTLYITFISSSISVVLGIIIAKLFVELSMKNEFIYKLPIIIPHIIVALFAIIFLSDTGFISRLLYSLGMSNSEKLFSDILFSKNGLGIIFSYIWKETPYVLLSTLAVLSRISGKHELAAINLGASKLYAFTKITIPMLLPTIISTFTIIFAFSFGSYEIPMLLGSTFPKSLPLQAFIEYQDPMMTNRPYAMAMNIIIIFFCVVFVSMLNFAIRRIVLKGGDIDE